ncbi:FUT6 isoform 8, partial [Pongo abelii]
MDPLGPAKPQWSWRCCLTALLFQLLVAVCFFSYLRVSRDDPTVYPNGSPFPDSTGTPAHSIPLILL